MSNEETRLLKVGEVADKLNVSVRTIYNRTRASSDNPFPVKPIRVGRSVRFNEADLERFMTRGE